MKNVDFFWVFDFFTPLVQNKQHWNFVCFESPCGVKSGQPQL